MKLLKYKVNKFRSVQSTDWIELDKVNALLGENESGKTNLLLPLWKLNPSSGGSISLLSDAPRSEYSELRDLPDDSKPFFITACFSLSNRERKLIASIAACEEVWVEEVEISRRYDGTYRVIFPKANPHRKCSVEQVADPIKNMVGKLEELEPNKKDVNPRIRLVEIAAELLGELEGAGDEVGAQGIQNVINTIDAFDLTKVSKTGGIIELVQEVTIALQEALGSVSAESPTSNEEARKKVIALMPAFIYYSNYGNLDGQIYLPRVIEDLGRGDLSEKESAKVRTLKVLFEFVKLKPTEILELGRDLQPPQVTEEAIEAKAEEKRERTVLLDSAGDSFTKSFSEWWRQGSYVIQFRADGDHFKIWVSDGLRSERIELENRSTGLQWFFSFFLVFLNERHDAHHGSILLLDEPGVTLHPMAQKDLFSFFEGLSADNQIIYTTHSPFLMDPDKLDQVKAVYVNKDGHSCVSSDLRARVNSGTDSEQKAIFPVHSALGISVSEVLFIGCTVILVEGPSDQYYLNAIKNILVGRGAIHPGKELVFVPSGGARGIKTTSKILAYDEENYPFVFLDSDSAGKEVRARLEETTYEGRSERIRSVGDFIAMDNVEVEDLIEPSLLARVVGREFRGKVDFEDECKAGEPIVPQIKRYCEQENIEMKKGWKVDIARNVKKKMSQLSYGQALTDEQLAPWINVFEQWVTQDG